MSSMIDDGMMGRWRWLACGLVASIAACNSGSNPAQGPGDALPDGGVTDVADAPSDGGGGGSDAGSDAPPGEPSPFPADPQGGR
jgi:hypothetical protein